MASVLFGRRQWLLFPFLLSFVLLHLHTPAAAQTWRWATRAGSPTDDWIQATTSDAAGNVYVIGNFSGQANIYGTILTSAGGSDVFVAKLLPVGIWDWAVKLGGRGDDYAGDIAIKSGNLYVTGSFADTATFGTRSIISAGDNDVFVAKIAARTGTWLWGVRGGGAGSDEGAGLTVNASGTIFLTGQFGGATARFGNVTLTNAAAGSSDGYLARLTESAGAWLGAIRVGGTGNEVLGRVALDAQGGVMALGAFDSPTIAFSTNINLTNSGSGTSDAFVGKLNAAGTAWQWATRLGGAGDDVARDLTIDAAKNAYVTGWFDSDSLRLGTTRLANARRGGTTNDAFVAKINGTGVWQWGARAGSAADELGYYLVADGTDLLVAGELGGTITAGLASVSNAGPVGTSDVFVARLTNTGTWVDVVRAGGTGDETPSGLVPLTGGLVILTGTFDSPSVAFGGITLTNNAPTGGSSDFFAAQLDSRVLNAAPADLPEAAGLDLWPNPAHGTVYLSGLPAEGATVQVIDALGRPVYTSHLETGTAYLDLTGLPAGVYFVRSGTKLRRLVVE